MREGGAVRIPPLGDSETRVSVTVRDVYGPDARFQDRAKIACPHYTRPCRATHTPAPRPRQPAMTTLALILFELRPLSQVVFHRLTRGFRHKWQALTMLPCVHVRLPCPSPQPHAQTLCARLHRVAKALLRDVGVAIGDTVSWGLVTLSSTAVSFAAQGCSKVVCCWQGGRSGTQRGDKTQPNSPLGF